MNRIDFIVSEIKRAQKRTGLLGNAIQMDNLIQRGPYTCISLNMLGDPRNTGGVGVAKCSSTDPYDEKVGLSIAIFRAVRDLRRALV